MNAIELRNIVKTYGSTLAVDGLTLAVPRGSVYGFIGPNGSGKTTTLRMIMNILYPDSGEILVFGEKLRKSATDRIGYMPEERGIYTRMKVRELLRFYARLKGGKNVKSEVDAWLERLELSAWADRKVEALSKGMRQKVQFIATVVSGPDVVLLDEPFTGLDPVNTEAIKDAVLGLRAAGTTVLFSTHDMNVAERMCDVIFMIFRGKKVLDGTLDAIQDRYGDDTLRVRTEGGAAALEGLEGVRKVNDLGQVQELRMAPGCDPQRVLAALLSRTRVRAFEVVRPSLNDIFLRIAGPGGEEAAHA